MNRLLLAASAIAMLFIASCGSSGPNPIVVIETSMGDIKVELLQNQAPVTVKNFLDYVDAKHYNGTVFHRVIADFMIQGGGFDIKSKEKPTKAPIKNESYNGLSNKRGTLAMARTSQPDSATAQFFINVKDNDFLDKAKAQDRVGYAVFGKVIDGMDVVDKIRGVETGTRKATMELPGGRFVEDNMEDWPKEDVLIKSIRRVDTKKTNGESK